MEDSSVSVWYAPFVTDCSNSVEHGWDCEQPCQHCTIYTGSPARQILSHLGLKFLFFSAINFHLKATLIIPLLGRSSGSPVHQEWKPQCRRNQHLEQKVPFIHHIHIYHIYHIYHIKSRFTYPMCQYVCQVFFVCWHIGLVVFRPLILPGWPFVIVMTIRFDDDFEMPTFSLPPSPVLSGPPQAPTRRTF